MHHSKILHGKGLIRNLKMLTQTQYSQIKFIGRLENIKGILNSLKAINFNSAATFEISDNGIRVIVESFKYLQASVYITKGCFTEFTVPADEMISFSINLNVIVDCLSIFASVECSVKMIYKGQGAPLVLVLEHHGEDHLITECSIKTKNKEEPLEFNIDEEGDSFNQVIIRGSELAKLFNEIDRSATELEIYLSPEAPYFRLTTLGVMQSETFVEVAKTSDMMIKFACKTITSMRYKLSQIKLVQKALLLATKVAIRTDSTGHLGMQLMVSPDDHAQIYIEYFIVPLIDDMD